MCIAAVGSPARAFVTDCHQGISTDALEAATWPLGAAPPALSDEQRRLIQDLPIDVSPRVTDFWSLSALVGNRYVDGGATDGKDAVAVAELTARPDAQREHCLRGPDDDGPAGDASALAACKAFILEQVAAALGDGDAPDLAAVENVRMHLVFRGDADVPLARYAFHLGQATHALQDSFTHAFRSPDLRQVRGVLNWVDWIRRSDFDPARDGFQHILALDDCGAGDVGGPERRDAALRATAELLAAVADDTGGRAGRLSRVGMVADAWFGVDPACTAANQWCDAPERKLISSSGCAVAPSGGGRAAAGVAFWLLLTCWAWRARRRPSRRDVVVTGLLLAGTMAFAAPLARAAATAPGEDPSRGEMKGGVLGKATPAEQAALISRPFGLVVSGGFSIDNAGYDVGVGARYDLGRTFTIGLGVEYSPWLSLETGRSTRGTTNAFAVGVFRLNVRDYLELRLTAEAGVSVLMFDAWAAPRGSVGPFFALSPLGVGIRMTGHLRLLIDPAEIVLSIPQTKGIPLAYREHRFAVAVQFNF